MYKMDTIPKQTPFSNQPSSSPPSIDTNNQTTITGDKPPLPSVVSRGMQADLQVQPANPSSRQTVSFEKQSSKVTMLSYSIVIINLFLFRLFLLKHSQVKHRVILAFIMC